jgi:hypothetical protein
MASALADEMVREQSPLIPTTEQPSEVTIDLADPLI